MGRPSFLRSVVDRNVVMRHILVIIIIIIIIEEEEIKICLFQDECMMDHETDGDGAINLSTSQRPSAATTPNGNIEYDEQDQVSTTAYF